MVSIRFAKWWMVSAMLAYAVALAPPLRGDVQADFDSRWAAKERRATVPSERVKLANDLIEAADDLALGRKKKESLAKAEDALAKLKGDRREEVKLLCHKAYQYGSKQRESYAAAAR